MSESVRPPLPRFSRQRRAKIADHWYTAIARTSFSPHRAEEVRDTLLVLTDHLISTLRSEPFAPEQARQIGATLAGLHYLQPSALAGTLDVLARQLVEGLSPERLSAVHPRLSAVIAALAAGYFAQGRALILEEQEQVRDALFVSRQHAEAAERARVQAEAAVRVRTDVLNAAAHDLRSPVTAILGHADLLRLRLERDPLTPPEALQAHATAIRSSATRIRAMVDELLDVARLQTGQALELQIEPVDMAALAREIARRWETDAHGTMRIIVDAPDGLIVEADHARLARVLDNLIGNAIKYSSAAAPVHVEARSEVNGVTMRVRDHGVGIPPEELPRLFTPFFRASTARGVPGIGIGLSGAKMIVEQHGGHITVQSALGEGTTITIALPGAVVEDSVRLAR